MFIFFYFVHCTPCYLSIWNWTGSIMNWKPVKSGEYKTHEILWIYSWHIHRIFSFFFIYFFNVIFMVLFLWFLWVWYHEKFINKAMKTPLQHETTVQKPRLMLIFKVFSFFFMMMMMMKILWIKQHQVFSSSIFSLSTKLSWLFLSHNFRLLIKEKK